MFRWGIIGLGRIAHKFAQELTQTSLGVVGAAASRDLAKAEDFTALYGGVPYGDYDDFISDACVDAVYVAVPHHLHFVLALKQNSAFKCSICPSEPCRQNSFNHKI